MSTAVLVQAGRSTADLIVRARDGVQFGTQPSQDAVDDITGLLLLPNLLVVLWFVRRTLADALAKEGEISLTSKLVGLGAAFLTCADLYGYATKWGHVERLAYAAPVLLYVFVVPFFMLRGTSGADDGRRGALQSAAVLELVLYALVPCVAAVAACSAYFSILNDGVSVFGTPILHSFVYRDLHQSARAEFWGFSPGIVGLGFVPVMLIVSRYRKMMPDSIEVGLDRPGTVRLLAATTFVVVLLAFSLVSTDALLLGATQSGRPSWGVPAAKAFLGLGILGLFITAFAASRSIATRKIGTTAKLLLQCAAFGIAGGLAGLIVAAIRFLLGRLNPHVMALAELHAMGFAIAFLAGQLSLRYLKNRLPDVMAGLDGGDPAKFKR